MEAPQPASAGVVFPEPEDKDFDDDIGEEERKHYVAKYKDLNSVKSVRLHCTACDRHLGCAAKADGRMRTHPMLRTLVCRACHTFYNSGEFERGDDGSELYCRWCGQGGQVYCCSACPHVFCAKCIKRNLGVAMTREIESLDDWKCFKCVPRELWDLRATCWALLRYCDLKNKLAYMTEDAELKEKYQKECAVDESECCRHKKRTSTPSRVKKEEKDKEKEKEEEDKKNALIAKIPSGIQVKKFATVSVDAILKAGERKAIKRPASPIRQKGVPMRAPIPIAPYPRPIAPLAQMLNATPRMPHPKRPKMQSPITMNQLLEPRKYTPRACRPRIPAIQYPPMNLAPLPTPSFGPCSYNGYNTFVNADNINLSLESLTQGLDMASVAAIATQPSFNDNDVVCTPDFPMEPLCEVTEDTHDDDVECITPGPVAPPKPPLLPPRSLRALPDLSPDNIIQMTDNDVTVNAVTGGLKFRVDPQTLSSNKMYRLPDGRIFAINSNPNMPGGYSATIVAVSDSSGGGAPTPAPLRGTTYAANLSAVVASTSNTPPPLTKLPRKSRNVSGTNTPSQPTRNARKSRGVDMSTPVEWYRYNLVDAVDALEYSLGRLQRLRKEADTRHLRTRTVDEMRSLHLQLERHLHTSSSRFQEIRENLNRGFKTYLRKKGTPASDDDDVEILTDEPPKSNVADDPIFIDENSLESGGDSAEQNEDSVRCLTPLGGDHNITAEVDTNRQKLHPFTHVGKEGNDDDTNAKDSNDPETEIQPLEKVLESTDLKDTSESDLKCPDSKDDTDSDDIGDADLKESSEGIAIEHKGSKNTESLDEFSLRNESAEKEEDNTGSKDTDEDTADIVETKTNSSIDDIQNCENSNDKDDQSEEILPDTKPVEKEDNLGNVGDMTDDAASPEKNKGSASPEKNESSATPEKIESSASPVKNESPVSPKKNENSASPEKNESSSESAVEEKSKMNGSDDVEAMDVDVANGETEPLGKSVDTDLQMSDEMIDDLLADDGAATELAADLHKFTERSLDSLADAEFN